MTDQSDLNGDHADRSGAGTLALSPDLQTNEKEIQRPLQADTGSARGAIRAIAVQIGLDPFSPVDLNTAPPCAAASRYLRGSDG
jgi:hypothetical protein